MHSAELKQIFSPAKTQNATVWQAKVVFCSGAEIMKVSARTANEKGAVAFNVKEPGTVLTVSEYWAPTIYCSWNSAQWCIAERTQVIAPCWYFLPQNERAESAEFLVCLHICLHWAQPGVMQLKLHVYILKAQRFFFFFFFNAAECTKKPADFVCSVLWRRKSMWELQTAAMVYCKV